jgi:hypothetical protein
VLLINSSSLSLAGFPQIDDWHVLFRREQECHGDGEALKTDAANYSPSKLMEILPST